ncbi:uncharacterized protein ASPGLDRAFT_52730 [Aspergillus glaucus CBS 516.65]|uniref:Uncharacterized protein n=1 Tax=Aspergillus glaucus CBS 516.65 TaxID=1160497 RepID=A0A1L9V5R5_ASPGL|nr:hypothetical protein ASPGLDRAFT_52730 [Aspergillus glaucus CBS 516.65]OJJ79277.1 hypothetical protein ASPGLDRAFT_52730 [Aspergillus glaucus CBS 516.65]
MNRHLKPEAEKIRKEIKEMIPETATEDNSNLEKADCLRSDDGRVMYAGEALANKVVTLRHYLGLGSDWGWTLWHFPAANELINKNSSMYLIPLSGSANIPEGGSLTEGSFMLITNNPIVRSGATVIIFMKIL